MLLDDSASSKRCVLTVKVGVPENRGPPLPLYILNKELSDKILLTGTLFHDTHTPMPEDQAHFSETSRALGGLSLAEFRAEGRQVVLSHSARQGECWILETLEGKMGGLDSLRVPLSSLYYLYFWTLSHQALF